MYKKLLIKDTESEKKGCSTEKWISIYDWILVIKIELLRADLRVGFKTPFRVETNLFSTSILFKN